MIIDSKIDLSVYYFLKNLFSSTSFINVVDGFPEEALVLPTIALELEDIDTYPSELGNHERNKIRTWYIDVFALNKRQRDELAYQIMSALEDDVPVYDYDEGFPPSSSPSEIGTIVTDTIKLQIIKVLPELNEKMYYRSLVIFTGEYSQS